MSESPALPFGMLCDGCPVVEGLRHLSCNCLRLISEGQTDFIEEMQEAWESRHDAD